MKILPASHVGQVQGASLTCSSSAFADEIRPWKLDCKPSGRIMKSTAICQADFEAILVSEVEALREGEEHLKRLYRQLPKKPHLRDFFLEKLSEVTHRAERLHAVLNPCEAFQVPTVEFSSPQMRPAA